jgi:5'-phosphate synthase pdxT subunit
VTRSGLRQRRDAILSPEFGLRSAGGEHPHVGVLALQGDFREHRLAMERLGAVTTEVRTVGQLQAVDALVIPGGESTTIGKLMREYGFVDAIRARHAGGMPVYGTCAGLITLARSIVEGDQPLLGLMDIVARRNAFGRQVHSFEADLQVRGLGEQPLRAVFIRAPWIEEAGPGVEVLARLGGHAVAARQGRLLATAFHPELTGDTRVHGLFLQLVREARLQREAARVTTGAAGEEVVS